MKSIMKKKVDKIGEYEFDEKTKSLYIKKSKRPLIIIFVLLIVVAFSMINNNENLIKEVGEVEATKVDKDQQENIYKMTDLIDIDKQEGELLVSNEAFNITKNTKNSESEEYVEYSFVSSEIELSEEDMKSLLRIVEAEATSEDIVGKILIANVIFNRVRDSGFPSTVDAVVHEKIGGKSQFSPIDDGRFYSVTVSKSTKEAVERALKGEDYSKGALFFAARRLASSHAMSWFDSSLTKVLQHGCHEFYNY